MKVTITGGGIGGLTTAIALRQKGIEVEIFEAANEFKQAGSGITLAINAMQIYQRLGLSEKLQQAGNRLDGIQICNQKLKVLSTANISSLKKQYKVENIAIHRAKLHEILLNELKDCPIHMGKQLKTLNQQEGKINLQFEDRTKHQCELLIGADGIHSVVRRSIFQDSRQRYAKQLCWRGIADFDLGKDYHFMAREAWAPGSRIGIVPIGPNTVYWYACKSYRDSADEVKDKLNEFAETYPPPVGRLINSTNKENIIVAELGDLQPIAKWYKGNICLMGDAAHATTPNMGQGANQAIESAWVLSECLSEEKDLPKAFAKYQKLRQAKAVSVVNTSWKIGKIAQLTNPVLAGLRNFFVWMTPGFIALKQLKNIFDLKY